MVEPKPLSSAGETEESAMEVWKILVFVVYPAAAFVVNVNRSPQPFTLGQTAGNRQQRQPLRPTATGGSASHGEEEADCNVRVRWMCLPVHCEKSMKLLRDVVFVLISCFATNVFASDVSLPFMSSCVQV